MVDTTTLTPSKMDKEHFTTVYFQRFKAFRDYSITLRRFNILVGPNNAGKSTILGAFRILAEGIRKARSRNPTLVPGPAGETWGIMWSSKVFQLRQRMYSSTTMNQDQQPSGLGYPMVMNLFFFSRSEVHVIFTATPKPKRFSLVHNS